MMPYIYSLAGMTYLNDYTIMRPLVMDFANDPQVNEIGDQFMFGPSVLVCPVYAYEQRKRDVYLPETAQWYDFYTGKAMKSGRQTVDAPYERIPLFVRQGAIIPFGPDMQYSTEKPADNLTLYVYKGQDGSFALYEDENENYNYEKGNYTLIPISYDDKTGVLTIDDRQGEYHGMLKEQIGRAHV